jgi:hypothetical protein
MPSVFSETFRGRTGGFFLSFSSGGFLNPNPKYGGILQFSRYNYINEAKAVIATKARNNLLYKFCGD